MNKELREDLEYLIRTDDKSITPDVRDDIQMTLDYIDKLEKENKILKENTIHNDKVVDKVNWENRLLKNKINKAIEYIHYSLNNPLCDEREALKYTLDILKGEDNESEESN